MNYLMKFKGYTVGKLGNMDAYLIALASVIREFGRAFLIMLQAIPKILVLLVVLAFFFAPEELRALISSIVNIEPERTISVLSALFVSFINWLNLYLVLVLVVAYSVLMRLGYKAERKGFEGRAVASAGSLLMPYSKDSAKSAAERMVDMIPSANKDSQDETKS